MVKEGFLEAASLDLNDLDSVKTAGAFQPQHSVHCELGEVVLVLAEDLGGQGGPGDVHEVLPESHLVLGVVGSRCLQGRQGYLGREGWRGKDI